MRSLLLVPATDGPALDAALGSGADAVVVDLLDDRGGDGEAARSEMVAFLARAGGTAQRPRLWVRINRFQSPRADADLDTAVASGADGIILAGACGGMDATRLDAKIAVAEAVHGLPDGRVRSIAQVGCTAQAVFQAGTMRGASHRLIGLTWAAEELAADLGASAIRDGDGAFFDSFRLARASTLLGAAAAEIAAIDGAYADAADLAGLEREARAAARDGFTAKLAIHPAQVPVIAAAFTPSPDAVAAAERVIAAFAANDDSASVVVDDRTLGRRELERARRLLARTGRS